MNNKEKFIYLLNKKLNFIHSWMIHSMLYNDICYDLKSIKDLNIGTSKYIKTTKSLEEVDSF